MKVSRLLEALNALDQDLMEDVEVVVYNAEADEYVPIDVVILRKQQASDEPVIALDY